MIGIRILTLIYIFSGVALGDTFLISEIFGKSSGRANDPKKMWIEIANVSGRALDINTIALDITADGKAVFKKRIYLKEPVKFVDYLIIAQEKNLGLLSCLRDEQPVVLITGFSIDNERRKNICVSINDQHKSCVEISQKVKLLPGTSIFRELADMSEMPLWRNEPCHLIDKTFASPGAPARFCSKMEKGRLFQRCDNLKELKISRLKRGIVGLEKTADDVTIEKAGNDSYKLRINKVHDEGLLKASLCAKPQEAKKICHLLGYEKFLDDKSPQNFSLESWQKNMGANAYFKISNLRGQNYHKQIENFDENIVDADAQNMASNLAEFLITDSAIIMTINLSQDELPFNVELETCHGEVVSQKSFVEAGIKTFQVPKPACEHIFVDFSGMRGGHRFLKKL